MDPQFTPILSQKSMLIASRLEPPQERLLNSQARTQNNIKKIKLELEKKFTFKPEICKSPRYLAKQKEREKQYLQTYTSELFERQIQKQFTPREMDRIASDDEHSEDIAEGSQQLSSVYLNGQQGNIWEKLYMSGLELKKKIDEKNQKQKYYNEKHEASELTFQPNILKIQPDCRRLNTEGDYNVINRCYQWASERDERLKKEREELSKRTDKNCTYHPQTGKPAKALQDSSYQQPLQNFEKISIFEQKGLQQFFQRIDKRNSNHEYIKQQNMKYNGAKWKNQVTIPQEFAFMKKYSTTQSTANLQGSARLMEKKSSGNGASQQRPSLTNTSRQEKNLINSYISVQSNNETLQQASSNYQQAIQDLHKQLMEMDE